MEYTPWIQEYIDNLKAQQIENEKYPKGHQLQEIVVTASGRPEDRMRANLQASIEKRQQKDARDKYTLQRNMNQAQEGVAHNFGMPLMFAATSPLGVLGWTAGSAAAHEAAKGHPTAEKAVNAAELGLLALGAGAGAFVIVKVLVTVPQYLGLVPVPVIVIVAVPAFLLSV